MGKAAASVGTEEVEKEEEEGVEEGEEVEGGGRMVRWERFLPRMFLRVLLVEADDSTRQIIAALLRKCNYRVAAVSDGLKAWETLKEKSQSIDLILTEVELPSVSGYALLTLIMEHEICKNIPVIMMSSHDSINMVFKCMLKGAADFLVKPIRKNELRNLWQHVWRRHSSNGGPGGTQGHQVGNLTQLKSEGYSENNAASNHSSDFIDSLQKIRECSKKGSDAQSSCTRPDIEAESAYMQNIQEQRQSNCNNSFVVHHMRGHKDMWDKLDEEQCETENRLALDVAHCSQVINSSDCILGKEDSNAGVTTQKTVISTGCVEDVNMQSENNEQESGQSKHSGEVDLIGAMDHQSQCKHGSKSCSAVQADVSNEEIIDDANYQKFNPSLELSLKRYQHIVPDNQEKEELNLLNHSHSSAFSRYNGRMMTIPLSTTNCFSSSELKYYSGNETRPTTNQSPVQSSTSQCDGLASKMNLEDSDSPDFCLPNQDGTTLCSSLGLLPFPLPMAGVTYDGMCPGYGSVMRPVFYTQSGLPMWSLNPSKREAAHASLSHQPDRGILNSGQSNHPHSQNSGRQLGEADKEPIQDLESLEEKRHVSSVTGQSRSSCICNGSRCHLSSSGCGSVCNGSNGNLTAICNGSSIDVSGSNTESAHRNGQFTHDGIKLVDIQRSIQREAALNKFRLKRKDRCFEKKGSLPKQEKTCRAASSDKRTICSPGEP